MGISKRLRYALLGALTVGALAVPANASAVELAGAWAPINRCPVDSAEVQNADGENSIAICAAANSPSGEIKLGKMEAQATGESDLQFAIVSDNEAGSFNVVNGVGGAIQSDPVKVKGGLLGLVCPLPTGDLIQDLLPNLCNLIADSPLNRVTAEVQSAGPITDFDLIAGLSEGSPILTLPVKIKLSNPFLGNNCFIGSEADPIVLHPANTDLSNVQVNFGQFAADGSEDPNGVMGLIQVAGATQGDSSFSVPKATGCGLLNLLDGAVNSKVGLPSPSGNNNLVLNDATTSLIGINDPTPFVPNAGKQLAEWWHAAVLP